jgi:hypothetical protein
MTDTLGRTRQVVMKDPAAGRINQKRDGADGQDILREMPFAIRAMMSARMLFAVTI